MSDNVGARKGELGNLTGIRALAAGWVVVEHFRLVIFALLPEVDGLRPWIAAGYLGVEVFFVLSGFIIAYNYAERFRTPSWAGYRQFLELRFARIYPTHLFTLIVMLVLVVGATRLGINLSAGNNYTAGNFIANLFMLQALPSFPSWNPPAWSISAEFAAYIAFPIIALVITRIRRASVALTAAAVLAISGGVIMTILQAHHFSPTGGTLIALRISVEFTTGCLLYVGWSMLRLTPTVWAWTAAAALVLIAVGIGVAGADLSLAVVPLIALFVLGCASAGGPIGRVLSSGVMRWGGRISYSVYMAHFIVLMVLGHVLPRVHFSGSALPTRIGVVAVYLAVAALAGWACYVMIEEPSRKLLRKLLQRRVPQRAQPDPVGPVQR